jgi:polyphosphate kinase
MILELMLRDNVKARELHADGKYAKIKAKTKQKRLDSQERQLEMSAQRLAQVKKDTDKS